MYIMNQNHIYWCNNSTLCSYYFVLLVRIAVSQGATD